jgi:hypothetical protein
MKYYTYTIKSDTTFPGAVISTTFDITGAAIKMQFREDSRIGAVALTLQDGAGITITGAYTFTINKFILTLDAKTYYSDAKIIINDDVYIPYEIKWIVTQNVTE